MLFSRISLVFMTAVMIGLTCAFLWVQAGLPTDLTGTPWDTAIRFFPSIYAVWLPLIYLFFSGVWLYLLHASPNPSIQTFWRLDRYSYAAVVLFFLLQIAWRDTGSTDAWMRVIIWGMLLLKSVLLLRAFYQSPHLIQPVLLVVSGIGIQALLIPFRYHSAMTPILQLTQHAEVVQLAIITAKSICINLITLEMFRLNIALTRSTRSAFFSWVIVTFTFPLLGFPKISYLLAGLLIIFILRLIFSRLDTRELTIGLLTTSNVFVLVKLLILVSILSAAGVIFWSNVKPGFEFRVEKAVQTAIRILVDGQFGVFSFAPIYLLACLGVVYVVYFKVWDGMLLILTGGFLYTGYHLVMYAMLDRLLEEQAITPFLSIFGVFMAIAHHRFGKMLVFRYSLRLVVIVTIAITSLLLLFYPEFSSVPSRMAEIQRALLMSLDLDLTYILPSLVFRSFSMSFYIWLSAILAIALLCCNARTRSGFAAISRLQTLLGRYLQLREFTFVPGIVLVFLLLGMLIIQGAPARHQVSLNHPVQLSKLQRQVAIPFDAPIRCTGILVVSNILGGTTIPQDAPVANLTVFDAQQHFEPFTLRIGSDTAEELVEKEDLQAHIAHERATLYRSWNVVTDDVTLITAHDYYTQFTFSRALDVQKIAIKFIDPQPGDLLSQTVLTIKEIALIQ